MRALMSIDEHEPAFGDGASWERYVHHALLDALIKGVEQARRAPGTFCKGVVDVYGRQVLWAVSRVTSDQAWALKNRGTEWRFMIGVKDLEGDKRAAVEQYLIQTSTVVFALLDPVQGRVAPLAPLKKTLDLWLDTMNTADGNFIQAKDGEVRIFYSLSHKLTA